MKTFRASTGPFTERPYFEPAEIEEICHEALATTGLYPTEPSPIRIERFIEKRFGAHVTYEDLPDGILGYTEFGSKGVLKVAVSRALDETGSRASERRISTTLAHEGGHGLLHAHLFALGADVRSMFGNEIDSRRPKILCRDEALPSAGGPGSRSYDKRWWEFQANRAIGGLLLPRSSAEQSLADLLEERGSLGRRFLPPSSRDEAVRLLADVFDVNPAVARIRLDDLYPSTEEGQLTL